MGVFGVFKIIVIIFVSLWVLDKVPIEGLFLFDPEVSLH